jgi:bifunctional UDP-N-acetylglucosamine pyrophosphorylase/glucosamine-1-phosphate N-acetyltransferase
VQSIVAPPRLTLGVNDRVQLAEASAVMRERICQRLMRAGVTMIDPATTYVDAEVEIGPDTVIAPGTTIAGATRIGQGCRIGPHSYLVDAEVGDRARISMSVVEQSAIGSDVQVGPFSHVRGGARIETGAWLGNYAEVKNSRLGAGTKMHHFSYVGDADVGENVNVAAGTITCNFDAETGLKSRTTIEDGAALGSDTMLVAPVTVGRDAITAAGSVVTRDVPPATVVLGVPARPVRPRRFHRRDAENAEGERQ